MIERTVRLRRGVFVSESMSFTVSGANSVTTCGQVCMARILGETARRLALNFEAEGEAFE